MQSPIKVAVYGGSFDPPHSGHANVSSNQVVARLTQIYDEVWVIPCGFRSDKHEMSSPAHRLAMTKLAFPETYVCKVKSVDIEIANETMIPTYLLMERLRTTYPDKRFFFVIGTDNLLSLHKWGYADRLISEVDFAVISRESYDTPIEFKSKPNFEFIDFIDESPESSTRIRKEIQEYPGPWNEAEFRDHFQRVNPRVLDYIIAEGLFGLDEVKLR